MMAGRQLRSDTAPEMATRREHCVSWDPPFGISAAQRWTCANCGSAVIKYGPNIYGSAVERDCPTPLRPAVHDDTEPCYPRYIRPGHLSDLEVRE